MNKSSLLPEEQAIIDSSFVLFSPKTNSFFAYQPHTNTYIHVDFTLLKPHDFLKTPQEKDAFPSWKKKPTEAYTIEPLTFFSQINWSKRKDHFLFTTLNQGNTVINNSESFKTYGLHWEVTQITKEENPLETEISTAANDKEKMVVNRV